MKTIKLTQVEFNNLPDFDKLNPANLKMGKKWKSKTSEGWLIGEVVLEGKVGIEWSKVEIIKKEII